ncbi:MAG: marine proteobacterial sortase target protein [Lautropia sp.]
MNATLDTRPAPDDLRPAPGARALPWILLLLRIVAGALAIGLALATALVLLLVVAGQQAQAAVPAQPTALADSAGGGGAGPGTDLERLRMHAASGLLIATPEGLRVAPLQSSDARLRVTGTTVRAVVTQRFLNPFPAADGRWLEGTYLFPLPDDAAVDHLRMRVGDRVIEGEIHERQAARALHAAARAAGHQVAMIEQQRPNAFRTAVSNIAPGATIEVEIEYQQGLALRDGRWTLRFPTVLTPRYARPVDDGGDGDVGAVAGSPEPAEAPEASSTQMPSTHQPSMRQPVIVGAHDLNPVSLQVEIDAGMPVTRPASASHHLRVDAQDADGDEAARWRVATADASPADRDFVLSWAPAPTHAASASMRIERHAEGLYGLLVVSPPNGALDTQPRLARETTFVIDTSGSMGGESIAQARRALLFALARLSPIDTFNVIQFNSTHASLWTAPRAADARAIAQAREWVGRLVATGGTEMRGALEQALSTPLPEGRLGQVVFITDGAIDHEDELIALVRERVGARRLFTVGIGSAPNGWFMRKTAEIGGGTHTMIGRTGEVELRMAALFDRISRPVSSGLSLDIEGARAVDTSRLPRELYAGEPLVVALRLDAVPTAVTVSGRHSSAWTVPVRVLETDGAGLHALWARERLEALGDELRRTVADSDAGRALRADAVRLALAHHLVSDWTSLVAVDHTVARPAEAPLDGGDVPANMPAGWSLPRTATPAPLQLAIGVLLFGLGFALLLNRRASQWIAATGVRRAPKASA